MSKMYCRSSKQQRSWHIMQSMWLITTACWDGELPTILSQSMEARKATSKTTNIFSTNRSGKDQDYIPRLKVAIVGSTTTRTTTTTTITLTTTTTSTTTTEPSQQQKNKTDCKSAKGLSGEISKDALQSNDITGKKGGGCQLPFVFVAWQILKYRYLDDYQRAPPCIHNYSMCSVPSEY